MTTTKSATARFKAVEPDDDEGAVESGQVEALVSVFGNVDSYGDVVMPGAFRDSLAEWDAKGLPIPFVWSHRWDDPHSIIGAIDEAVETTEGLVVKATLDLDNPLAAQVYRLLKAGTIAQFSFGFDVRDGGWGTRRDADGTERDVYELRSLDLIEAGPCLRGVNRATEVIAVKGEPPTRTTTTPERKGEPGSAAPRITADAINAWAFTNDPEGGAA